jgi:hypothetical protein
VCSSLGTTVTCGGENESVNNNESCSELSNSKNISDGPCMWIFNFDGENGTCISESNVTNCNMILNKQQCLEINETLIKKQCDWFPSGEEKERCNNRVISGGCEFYGEYVCKSKVKVDNNSTVNEEYCMWNETSGICTVFKEEDHSGGNNSKPVMEISIKVPVWVIIVIATVAVIFIVLIISCFVYRRASKTRNYEFLKDNVSINKEVSFFFLILYILILFLYFLFFILFVH